MSEKSTTMEIEDISKELYLNVGLSNGVLLKTAVDPVTGSLTDTRTRYYFFKNQRFKLLLVSLEQVLDFSKFKLCNNQLF